MTLKSADAAVIGGGAVGCSIAYRLARAGVEVVLLDKGSICSGTSGATFAWVGAHGMKPASYYRLRRASLALYPHLSKELGFDIEFHPQGSLITLKDAAAAHAARAEVSSLQEAGYEMEFLEPARLYRLEPNLWEGFHGATYCPLGGSLNPFRLVHGYAKEALNHGARILPHSEVNGIRMEKGGVHSVSTASGEIRVKQVVNATGIYAPSIGRMVGIDIPLRPVRGQVLVTEPLPSLINHIVDDLKQTPGGNILVGRLDEEAGYDNTCTLEGIQALAQNALKALPAVKETHFIRTYSGLRPMPPDELPILGEAQGVTGFFNAVMHSGITLSAIVGLLMAQLMTTGETEIPIQQYSLNRFNG